MLQIEVPVCELNGFKCVETSVSHRYKYKHLKTALSNIPQRDPAAVNSKVGRTVRTPGCTVSRLQVGAVLGLHLGSFPAQGSWAAECLFLCLRVAALFAASLSFKRK